MSKASDVTYVRPKAGVTYVKVEAKTAYQFARGEITWAEVQATAIDLNYYSLNRYFGPDLISISDSAALNSTKALADNLALSDSQQLNVQKQIADALSFSDSVDVVLIIQRAFSDSTAISDVSVIAVDKNISETVTISELASIALSIPKTDSFSLAEAASLNTSKPFSDSVGMSDSFARTAVYARSFTDAFSLDDTEEHLNGALINKTNVFSFSDTNTFSFEKGATETVSFSDNFSHSVVRINRAVLNTSAFNTFALNS